MKGDLRKAAKLYKRGKYPQVIRLLEPQIFRYRQNYDFFYLVGMSCLHTGDLGGGSTYLQRGLGLKPNDIKASLGLALVHLKRNDVEEAIRCYLEILDSEPANRIARRGLTLLQKDPTTSRIQELNESGRLDRLRPDRRRRSARPVIITASAVLAVALTAALLWYFGLFDRSTSVREPAVEAMSIDEMANIVDFSGEYRYVLTEKEIKDTFTQAKKHFAEFRDNLAQRDINRLLGSNASPSVKEEARIISGYIPTPDFTTIKDPFDYQSVATDPFLYNNTYVVWSGKLTNLVVTDDKITFDLLVGYETNQLLLGVVPVVLKFAAFLEVGNAVELLGRIRLAADNSFLLEAVSVHKLPPGSRS